MSEELFRQQAIEAKRPPWLGSVRLVTPVSQGLWAMAVLLMGMAIALWLCVGRYTQSEHMAGMLVPQAGLVDITSRSAGTVTALQVEAPAAPRQPMARMDR